MKKGMVLLLLSLFLLLPLYLLTTPEEHPVSIFVIDSDFRPVPARGSGRTLQAFPGHGQLVRDIIADTKGRAKADIYTLEISAGGPERNRVNVINHLRDIKNYAISEEDTRILVNISLAFSVAEEEEKSLLRDLKELGVIVVAAAGNSGDEQVFYPAKYDSVLAVTAATSRRVAPYASYGEQVDLAASGDITRYLPSEFSSYSLNPYRSTGTSFAAPRVVGAIAEVAAARGLELSSEQLIAEVRSATTSIDDYLFEEGLLGSGLFRREQFLLSLAPANYWHTRLFYLLLLNGALLLFFAGKYLQDYRYLKSLEKIDKGRELFQVAKKAKARHWPHIQSNLADFSQEEKLQFAQRSFSLPLENKVWTNFWQQETEEFLVLTLQQLLSKNEVDPERIAEKIGRAIPDKGEKLIPRLEKDLELTEDFRGINSRFKLALYLEIDREKAREFAFTLLQERQQVWIVYYALYTLQETGTQGLPEEELLSVIEKIKNRGEVLLKQEASRLEKMVRTDYCCH